MFKKNPHITQYQYLPIRQGAKQPAIDHSFHRPQRDYQIIQKTQQSKVTNQNQKQLLTVLQTQEYIKLEDVLTKKLKMIMDNIQIASEKNKLKDREIQILSQSYDKIVDKINNLEQKLDLKEKKLKNVSLKCHEITQKIAKRYQIAQREQILFLEQKAKCQSFIDDIKILQSKSDSAQKEVDTLKKLYDSLDNLEQQNSQLRQKLSQLQNQQKLIEYRHNSQKGQCQEIQNKLEQLKSVYQERNKVNKRNLVRLNNLKKQISQLHDNNDFMDKKSEQIKRLQLQFGELNQQLLLSNQQISEIDFKIRKKQKNIGQLKQKAKLKKQSNEVSYKLRESHRIIQSGDEIARTENNSSKTSRQHSNSKINKQLSVNSKNASPARNRSNLTPTFPSNELHLHNQGHSNPMKSMDDLPSTDAFKNIQKLINRFQQIKSKEKYRNT